MTPFSVMKNTIEIYCQLDFMIDNIFTLFVVKNDYLKRDQEPHKLHGALLCARIFTNYRQYPSVNSKLGAPFMQPCLFGTPVAKRNWRLSARHCLWIRNHGIAGQNPSVGSRMEPKLEKRGMGVRWGPSSHKRQGGRVPLGSKHQRNAKWWNPTLGGEPTGLA